MELPEYLRFVADRLESDQCKDNKKEYLRVVGVTIDALKQVVEDNK